MSERRRGLGRGLGALIPTEGMRTGTVTRPSDMFFLDDSQRQADGAAKDAAQAPSGRAGGTQDDVVGEPRPAGGPREAGGSERPPAEHLTDGLSPVPGAEFALIPLNEIRPNPRQPRSVFDEEQLDELVHSIREIGLLQPVVVRPLKAGEEVDSDGSADATGAGNGGPEIRYELIMGERRWRASREAGLTEIPAIVKDTPDDAMLRDALLENLHRSQLNPLEEAAAYQQLLEDFGCTHEVLADRLGRSRPQITNTIRLLKLPPLVGRRVAAGVLSAGHARALLRLDDPAAMERLAQRIVAEGLSVRSVEEIVSLHEAGADEPRRRPTRTAARPQPELENLASFLADRLETRVSIKMGRRNGKLTVEFASTEDLQRILDAIGESAPLGSEKLASPSGDHTDE